MPGGYGYDPAQLAAVVRMLHDGAEHLEQANRDAVEMVDAGASSKIVGDALAKLLESSITTAYLADAAADGVNAAKGTYDEIEETTKDRIGEAFEDGPPIGTW